MTQNSTPAEKPAPKADKATKTEDAALADLQKAADERSAKGYEGTLPDGPTGKDYSLQSGPESPGAYEIREGEF